MIYKVIALYLLLALLATATFGSILPIPNITPGAIASRAVSNVCRDQFVAPIPLSVRRQVYIEYGQTSQDDYPVDHLVPLALGGSNDIKNLWPRPDDWVIKDQLAARLRILVCTGQMMLVNAQFCIRVNWHACRNRLIRQGDFYAAD